MQERLEGIDWPGELLYFALTGGFVGGVLLYAGLGWLIALAVALAIEVGHIWNSGVLER